MDTPTMRPFLEGSHVLALNLGELEDGVSTAEQLLEVLGDNKVEEEDAEEVGGYIGGRSHHVR